MLSRVREAEGEKKGRPSVEEEVNSGWSGTHQRSDGRGEVETTAVEMVARLGWLPVGCGRVVGVAETIRTLRRQQPQPSATPAMP